MLDPWEPTETGDNAWLRMRSSTDFGFPVKRIAGWALGGAGVLGFSINSLAAPYIFARTGDLARASPRTNGEIGVGESEITAGLDELPSSMRPCV